jgi:hypothetical protein
MVQRSPEYHLVVSTLRALSIDDLRAVQHQVRALLSISGVVAGDVEKSAAATVDGVSIVLRQLLLFLQRKGLYEYEVSEKSISVFRNAKRVFIPKCEILWRFIEKQTGKRLEREALLRLGFECHYDHLQTWMAVVGVQGMLQFIDQVPMSLDAQFPGYARAKLLVCTISKGNHLHV